jgi:hypothetical protein
MAADIFSTLRRSDMSCTDIDLVPLLTDAVALQNRSVIFSWLATAKTNDGFTEVYDTLYGYLTDGDAEGEDEDALIMLFDVMRCADISFLEFDAYYREKCIDHGLVLLFADWDCPRVLRYLSEYMDIEKPDENNSTPLHEAIGWGWRSEHAARILLELGADPNAQNDCKETPLMLAAAQHYDPDMCTLLLEHGANRTLVNNDGQTAYDVAKSFDMLDAEKIATLKP